MCIKNYSNFIECFSNFRAKITDYSSSNGFWKKRKIRLKSIWKKSQRMEMSLVCLYFQPTNCGINRTLLSVVQVACLLPTKVSFIWEQLFQQTFDYLCVTYRSAIFCKNYIIQTSANHGFTWFFIIFTFRCCL